MLIGMNLSAMREEVCYMPLLPEWYAIQVRSLHERVAAASLRHKGYEVLLPVFVVHTSRQIVAERILFPGYLFCRISQDICAKIVTTPGVIRILGLGKVPVAVEECEMDAVRQLVNSPLAKRPCAYVATGTRVRIGSGPLSGVEGVVLDDAEGKKLVMSITILRRSVAALLPPETLLEPVSSPSDPGQIFQAHPKCAPKGLELSRPSRYARVA
jgi:transcription antitermination factor NusG